MQALQHASCQILPRPCGFFRQRANQAGDCKVERYVPGYVQRDSLKKASGNYKKKNKVRMSKNLRTRLFEEGQLELQEKKQIIMKEIFRFGVNLRNPNVQRIAERDALKKATWKKKYHGKEKSLVRIFLRITMSAK